MGSITGEIRTSLTLVNNIESTVTVRTTMSITIMVNSTPRILKTARISDVIRREESCRYIFEIWYGPSVVNTLGRLLTFSVQWFSRL